jgi:hypothetical protein
MLIEPGSAQWHAARLGKFTASEIHKLMGERGGLNTATALTYIYERAAEEMTGHPITSRDSAATEWGIEHEPDAREYYEIAFKCQVEKQDPIVAWFTDQAGCTPDGIVTPINHMSKGVEIKCPYNSANHLRHMSIRDAATFKEVSKEYYWQVQMCMLITKLSKWDFISYDPRFTGRLRMYVCEIKQEVSDMERLQETIMQAVEIKNNIIKKLKK